MHALKRRDIEQNGAASGRGLRIAVVSAVGHGQTLLSAYDDALHAAGTSDYNLITLSSVIPTASDVVDIERFSAPTEEYGFKLFVVQAAARSDAPGSVVAAGLGWLQRADRAGVFVEHHAVVEGEPCAAVEHALAGQINASLFDLALRRNLDFAPDRVQSRIVSAPVTTQPACALVLAIYQAQGWSDSGPRNGKAQR